MKVLFVSAADSPDLSAGFLWDGLQTVLGPENVADAMRGTALRGLPEGKWANSRPIRYFEKHRVPEIDEDDFDLLIATSTFLRSRDWNWLGTLAADRLKKGAKVVWFDTLDGAADIVVPQVPVDAIFKREIDPAIHYARHYPQPLSLLTAMPERWLYDEKYGWTENKPYDVFNVSNAVTTGWPTRWNSLSPTFGTSRRTHALAGAGVLQPNWVYLHVMRMFKLVVDSPGAEGASDSCRTWETIAAGGIPLFLEQQCRPRWPWFTGEHCFWCDRVEELAGAIEKALDSDLQARRLRLREHVLKYHTTEQRARQFLLMVEKDAWRGTPGPWSW